MVSLQPRSEDHRNPLDLLEELVSANDWPFQRASDCELMVEVGGRWSVYRMFIVWQEDLSAIFFSCQLEQKVPDTRRREVCELLAAINEGLWLGHFDLAAEDALLLFRHTIPLRGAPGASVEQLEDLVDAAVVECERFYPALQMVVWGGQTVTTAISAALMDTVGEA
jgi:hypothetical protein